MSLYKQLLIGICLFTIVLFGGNFFITLDSSREQYNNQLKAHSQDAATALGVSLTGHINDPAMTQLLVDSIFDSGYFYSIRVVDVKTGKPLIERESTVRNVEVPHWFEQLVTLKPGQGDAIILNGWSQAGRVEVVSHPMFALARLWANLLASFLWLFSCSLVGVLFAILMLHRSLQPLNHIVEQAKSICRREFRNVHTIPKTPELRRVVEASNMMVTQLETLFSEQALRTESLREAAWLDVLTGLNNRRAFDLKLQSVLSDEENAFGHLILLRVQDLTGLNQRMGGEKTDALLTSVAAIMFELQQRFFRINGFLARLRGGDFAILTPDILPPELENMLTMQLKALYDTGMSDVDPVANFAKVAFKKGDTPQTLLTHADRALMSVETGRQDFVVSDGAPATSGEDDHHRWFTRLAAVLHAEVFELFWQPVFECGEQHHVLHHKILARIRTEDGEIMPAGIFMPWIHRFSLGHQMDVVMLKQTLRMMATNTLPMALSISGESVANDENLNALLALLKNNPQQAGRLTLELDENEIPDPQCVSNLVKKLKVVHCGLGIQHFGGRFNLIGNLPQWGLAWLKIDSDYIRNIDTEEDKKLFIEAMYWAARQIDLPLIAERVETAGELAILNKIGLYGVMGRYFGEPGAFSLQ
jgi:EAL domain-containing protein (putative c-di-GMP-specific phosphodiesterase class I)/GGDEF domain-containing protein